MAGDLGRDDPGDRVDVHARLGVETGDPRSPPGTWRTARTSAVPGRRRGCAWSMALARAGALLTDGVSANSTPNAITASMTRASTAPGASAAPASDGAGRAGRAGRPRPGRRGTRRKRRKRRGSMVIRVRIVLRVGVVLGVVAVRVPGRRAVRQRRRRRVVAHPRCPRITRPTPPGPVPVPSSAAPSGRGPSRGYAGPTPVKQRRIIALSARSARFPGKRPHEGYAT